MRVSLVASLVARKAKQGKGYRQAQPQQPDNHTFFVQTYKQGACNMHISISYLS